jgi:hypothetical protein
LTTIYDGNSIINSGQAIATLIYMQYDIIDEEEVSYFFI